MDNDSKKRFTFSTFTKEEGLNIVHDTIKVHSDYDTPFLDIDSEYQRYFFHTENLTPRKLLQLIGTEGGRDLIHENIWVNALFSSYTKDSKWIIPDTRFDNEAKAIKDRGGIIIKVERDVNITDNHASEKGISDEYIDIVIDNNGSMEELIEKVKTIL